MKILLTDEELKKLLYAAFCGAGHIHYGDMQILVSKEDYNTAKLIVKERFGEDFIICREDVWIEALNQDFEVKILDREDEESYLITPERLARLGNLPCNITWKVLEDDGDYDADDLDWVLEYIMFNDKIYG